MKNKTAILTFRLPQSEQDYLREAAKQAKESQSEYARQAIKERIQGGTRTITAINGSVGYVIGNQNISFDFRPVYTTGPTCSFSFQVVYP